VRFEVNNPLEIDIGDSSISSVPNNPEDIFSVLANRTNRKTTLRTQVSGETW
jgi:hypothetical protein